MLCSASLPVERHRFKQSAEGQMTLDDTLCQGFAAFGRNKIRLLLPEIGDTRLVIGKAFVTGKQTLEWLCDN